MANYSADMHSIYSNVSPETIRVVKDGDNGQLGCRFKFMDSDADGSASATSTNLGKHSDYGKHSSTSCTTWVDVYF